MADSSENCITGVDIPKPGPGLRWEAFDNELVLYHMASTQAIFLNETAALVFRLCDGKRSLDEICSLIQKAYPESCDHVEADVYAALQELVRSGAVTC
jgi:hypothetical protein